MVVNRFFALSPDDLYAALATGPSGLSDEEAARRLEQEGPNELPKVSKGFLKVYLAPLFNWLIVIYLVGATILLVATVLGEEGSMTMIALTLGIVLLNCLIAIFQQLRATKKLEALKALSAPTATVVRGGEKKVVPSREVVPGDILVLSQGDRVAADARLIECSNLETNEASLTGESEPVRKDASTLSVPNSAEVPLVDQRNVVFYGTHVTTGNGKAIVVSTGAATQIGKISAGLDEAGSGEIPIRQKMNNFGKWLGLAVLAFWAVVFLITWGATGKATVFKSLNSAMDIMPINIPLLVTIVLLTGVLNMAQHGVIVRNIASVDSLGRVSVVCTDKTGTLTKSEMSVRDVWVDHQLYEVEGVGYDPVGTAYLVGDGGKRTPVGDVRAHAGLWSLVLTGVLNNNAGITERKIQLDDREVSRWAAVGSPTEAALVTLYRKLAKEEDLKGYHFVAEYPFNSSVKRMTKVYRRDGRLVGFTKGAAEVVLPACTRVGRRDGRVDPLDEEERGLIKRTIDEFAGRGYRVLVLCLRELGDLTLSQEDPQAAREEVERDLTFLGFVTILDPPREGVKEAVDACHRAGVDVVMITGDSPVTARAIARAIDVVVSDDEKVVEGKDIPEVASDEEFNKIRVFARVSPVHKQEIVERYQRQKKVVAMTGDGVNDSLALNMADAGIAMGIQGTDVAKEASDMVISDDSFTSIVTGIHQGRGIFAKIRAVVFFYICINLFEGIVQFVLSPVLNLPYFLDEQFYLMWIFLSVTVHVFPGLILTFDTISDDVMEQKPRNSEEILSRNTFALLLAFGGLLAVSMLAVYFLVMSGTYPVVPHNLEFGSLDPYYLYTASTYHLTPTVNVKHAKALTMLMTTLFFCESMLAFQIRRPNKGTWRSLKEDKNKYLWSVTALLFGVFFFLMYVPGVQTSLAAVGINFGFMFLTGLDWLVCLGCALLCNATFEVVKLVAIRRGVKF
ncbi:MAG: calcium-translocating P-type ATPase, SERCA-type [Promethearchaeota archaeon]